MAHISNHHKTQSCETKNPICIKGYYTVSRSNITNNKIQAQLLLKFLSNSCKISNSRTTAVLFYVRRNRVWIKSPSTPTIKAWNLEPTALTSTYALQHGAPPYWPLRTIPLGSERTMAQKCIRLEMVGNSLCNARRPWRMVQQEVKTK